jgi:hypothetical protein
MYFSIAAPAVALSWAMSGGACGRCARRGLGLGMLEQLSRRLP